MPSPSRSLTAAGAALLAAAGLRAFGLDAPSTALTFAGVALLAAAKFVQAPAPAAEGPTGLPSLPAAWRPAFERFLPTITRLVRRADALLRNHRRFERSVGGGDAESYRLWLLSGLRAALYWTPVSLLAMLAGAALVSPLRLVTSGLDLGGTAEGQWLLRQSWPLLLSRVLASQTCREIYLLAGYSVWVSGLKRVPALASRAEAIAGALAGLTALAALRWEGLAWMRALPLLGIELSLIYAYARSGTLLIPAAASLVLGLASLYSARMVVLLTAKPDPAAALPGIPGFDGVLAALGLSLALFLLLSFVRPRQWERLKSAGDRWRAAGDEPKSPLGLARLGLLWGIAVYLVGYLAYYGVHFFIPADETVPPILQQTLLMPLDVLVYIFLIGAALEELIFRYGLFGALGGRGEAQKAPFGFWAAALLSAAVFSGFHFLDFGAALGFLGIGVSRLVKSMLITYGFSWAGFAGRVAAGVLLAGIYRRSRVLFVGIVAHFTSNLLEAVGLRWGLLCLLSSVTLIIALQLSERRSS